jgi:hypothetical protein
VRTRNASEWRDFWRGRGERELRLLLWAAWDPVGGVPPGEYDAYAPRIASLLASRASREALAAELDRIRVHELGVGPDPERDLAAAGKIADWFEAA